MATSENIPDIKEMDNLLDEIEDDSERRKKWEQEEEPWSAKVQLPKVDDNNETNLEWSIKACVCKNEPETGIDILEKMIEKDPKNAELHYQYAVLIRSYLKDFKRIEKELLIAVNYDANHALALWGLADLYKNDLNDYPPARYYFKRLLKVKPTFGIGWKEYGDLLGWRLNEWKDAVIAYEEAIKLKHEYLWQSYNNSAFGYARRLGNPEKGKLYYAKACELGNAAVSWSHLGKIYLEFFNNPKEAEPCFRKAIEIKEKQAEAHTFLGQILSKKVGDIDAIEEAKKHLIRALELGENRAKETLQEIIKREQKQKQGAQAQEEKEKESQKVEVFRNHDRTIGTLGKASESITASNDAKLLCCAGADGEIFLYDLTQLDANNLSDTKQYTFFKLADHNCNEVQFSHSDTLLAAAFFHPNSKNSKLLIFNISSLKTKGLSPENISTSNVAIHQCQFQTRLFTNAVRFSADDSKVVIGLGLYYAEHCPLYLINTKDGKMETDVYTNVLLKQCSLNVDNLEGISALYLVDCILVCGTTHGRIFVIDIASLELLYSYRHRTSATGASRISTVYLTGDLRWIISADIYGTMNFYFIQLQNDMTDAKKTQNIMQKYKTVVGHRLIYDIVFVSEYNDVHFRSVTELQAHNDRLICSSSHDGNLTLFELINEDIYTGAAMVRIISRIESVHEYLPINSVCWRLTHLGLNLFTTGDDKRVIIHLLSDILLDALPESLDLKKPHQYKRRYFNMENLEESQKHFETIVVEERHKLNGWLNLWSHGNITDTERNDTSDMAGAALNTLQILTEPIILNLKEDKVKYERVYARMALDATDTEGLNQINALIENVIKANKAVYDSDAKQSKDSLIQLMMDAFAADQELQTLAVELSSDPAISGMYEGNPGIKKMKRAVEKTLLRNLEINREFSFDKELDFGYLKDLSRAGITCRDCKAIYTALDKIIKVKKNEVEIVRIKNRFIPESEFGYRDILVNLRFIQVDQENKRQEKYSGHIVELQLHHEKFQNVRKKGKGHANYSATRFMMDFIKISTKLDEYKKGKEEQEEEKEKDEKLSQESPQQAIKRNLNELWNLQLD